MEEKRKFYELDDAVLDSVSGGNNGIVEQLQDTPRTIEGDSSKNTDPLWIKETSGDTGAYYGLENPAKTLEDDSRFWVKLQDKDKQ